MTISRRTVALLGIVFALLALSLCARLIAASAPAPLPVREGVVQDVPLRVGPSVNLTPDDPAVMRDDPTRSPESTRTSEPPTVEPSIPDPTRPTTPARRPVLRPVPTDGSPPPVVEEYEPADPLPVNPPVATDTTPIPTS